MKTEQKCARRLTFVHVLITVLILYYTTVAEVPRSSFDSNSDGIHSKGAKKNKHYLVTLAYSNIVRNN